MLSVPLDGSQTLFKYTYTHTQPHTVHSQAQKHSNSNIAHITSTPPSTTLYTQICPPKHTNTISYTENHSNLSVVDIMQIEIRSEQVQKFQYGTIVSKHSRTAEPKCREGQTIKMQFMGQSN